MKLSLRNADAIPCRVAQFDTSPCQQRQAAAYCEEIKRSPGCLELCLRRFPSSPYIEVRFWCLQTLHEVKASNSYHSCPRHESLWTSCSDHKTSYGLSVLSMQILQKGPSASDPQQLNLVWTFPHATSKASAPAWRASARHRTVESTHHCRHQETINQVLASFCQAARSLLDRVVVWYSSWVGTQCSKCRRQCNERRLLCR